MLVGSEVPTPTNFFCLNNPSCWCFAFLLHVRGAILLLLGNADAAVKTRQYAHVARRLHPLLYLELTSHPLLKVLTLIRVTVAAILGWGPFYSPYHHLMLFKEDP